MTVKLVDRTDSMVDVLSDILKAIGNKNYQISKKALPVVRGSNLTEPSCDLISVYDSRRCSTGTEIQSFC